MGHTCAYARLLAPIESARRPCLRCPNCACFCFWRRPPPRCPFFAIAEVHSLTYLVKRHACLQGRQNDYKNDQIFTTLIGPHLRPHMGRNWGSNRAQVWTHLEYPTQRQIEPSRPSNCYILSVTSATRSNSLNALRIYESNWCILSVTSATLFICLKSSELLPYGV
jgi:hypothetical protein